ncbi:MAG: hypothetical protein JNK45_10895 [Myxococcales bacterium]|nr:hypothetical protein [Myxococcales bacterium]
MATRSMATRPEATGDEHETLGSDILAVPKALASLARLGRLGPRALLDQVLGTSMVARLGAVEPTGWYPIAWLLEMTDVLDTRLGEFGLRRVGRTLFELSHADQVRARLSCGMHIVQGIDAMYRHANRGRDIGGWTVRSVHEHGAMLEKTTPHHCAMEEGIVSAAMAAVDCRVVVSQPTCTRRGDDLCRFEVSLLTGPWLPAAHAALL